MSLLDPKNHFLALRELIQLLTRHRYLTWEMTKREIKDRYAGQILGSFWTIGNPIILLATYVFIFTYVFPSRSGREFASSHTPYILSGLIPWLAFQESMSKGCGVIISHANLVKQVIFPLEILPVKVALACFVTQAICTVMFIFYVVIWFRTLPVTYFLLFPLFAIQLLAMIGVSYALSAVGVYFKDLKDFVQVFLSMGLFLAPILYMPDMVPKSLEPFLVLNPFTHMVWCYQDACYFGRFEHPWAWLIFAGFGLGSFYCGYRVFRKLRIMFGNVL